MQGEIITITSDGAVSRQPVGNPDNLPALNAAVGGTIGYVPGFDLYEGRPCDAYVNDDGIPDGLPVNPEATRLWLAQFTGGASPARGRLHGPIAIVTGDEAFMRAQREF